MWDGAPILTAQGLVPVESLTQGTQLLTSSGQVRRLVSVAKHGEALPGPAISFIAQALGSAHPNRDIDLLPDWPVLIDDVVLPAKSLVNGATIRTRLLNDAGPSWRLMVEGADAEACEPPTVYAPMLRPDGIVHADDASMAALKTHAAPRAIKQRLIDIAAQAGHLLSDDPDLHIIVDGRATAPRRNKGNRYLFAVPSGARSLQLMSRTWVPSDVVPGSGDERVLGVCVRRIVLDGHEIALSEFDAGWSKLEDHGKLSVRWTQGSAVIPVSSPRYLDVELYGSGQYWVAAPQGV